MQWFFLSNNYLILMNLLKFEEETLKYKINESRRPWSKKETKKAVIRKKYLQNMP